MGKKPKAGGAPRKAQEPKLEDKEQSERFIQAARELGADETGATFEKAFPMIVKSNRDQKPKGSE